MLWLLMLLAVTQLTDSTIPSYKNYSYIKNVGIPAAKRRLEFERSIMERSDGINTRIIGGFEANHVNYPWLAGLTVHMSINVSICGGSLLNPTRVLTAGHCWYDIAEFWIPEMMEVVLGSSFLFYGGTRIMTNRVITHPNWKPGIPDEVDAAIVILPKAVTYSDKIQPIALPENYMGVTFDNWIVYAAGYGLIQYSIYYGGSAASDHDTGIRSLLANRRGSILEVNKYECLNAHDSNPLIDSDSCHQFKTNQFILAPFEVLAEYNQAVYLKMMSKTECNPGVNMMCTSGEGNKGVCSGDSGGPLSIYHNGQNVLIGIIIASLGVYECEKGQPSVHVKVINILDWIKSNLK